METNELAIVREALEKLLLASKPFAGCGEALRYAETFNWGKRIDDEKKIMTIPNEVTGFGVAQIRDLRKIEEAYLNAKSALSALSAHEERMGSEELVEKVAESMRGEYIDGLAHSSKKLIAHPPMNLARKAINAIRGVGDERN